MRISVIGVGAVGGSLAALLDRSGHEVFAVTRGETAHSISTHGMRLHGARGSHTAAITTLSAPATDSDLVIIAVRTYDNAAVLHEHARAIGDAPVLLVQNGLTGPDLAASILGRSGGHGVLAGLSLFPATRIAPGEVSITGPGGLRVGHAHPADGRLARRVASVCNEALPTVAIANLRGALWSKLLVNHVNALPAITGTSVQAVCRHPLLAKVLAAGLARAVDVADASRVRFAGVGVIEPAHVTRIRQGHALEVVTGRFAHAFGHQPNPASTLQSIRRGDRTEIDDLDGAVVRAAAQVGMRAPVQEMMVSLVHRVARTGHFLPAALVHRCVLDGQS